MMNDLEPLYDRIEVLEKTVELLASHLGLQAITHEGMYVELKERNETLPD
jgi:hypothetical protein